MEGKVKSLSKFGAFITLPDGSTGMVHISEIAHAYVNDIRDHLTEGQDVKVMIISRENGKTNLSIKRTLPPPAKPQLRFCAEVQRLQRPVLCAAPDGKRARAAAAEIVRRYAQAIYDRVEQQNVFHQAVLRA